MEKSIKVTNGTNSRVPVTDTGSINRQKCQVITSFKRIPPYQASQKYENPMVTAMGQDMC